MMVGPTTSSSKRIGKATGMTKTAVVITGASRGFGRCLALDFAREVACSDVDMHLWARHAEDLKETERQVQAAWSSKADVRKLKTFVQSVDLGKYADYSSKVDALLEQLKTETYERIILVHNAGSLGDLCYSQEWDSHDMLTQYWEFNVTSMMWLNKRFLDVYGLSRGQRASGGALSVSPVLGILNVTSLCAIEPFSTHGLYCTGKAAREMHLRVLAKEQPQTNLRVLSYSPGPMDTDMQRTIRESPLVDQELAKMYATMHAEGRLVDPQTSSKLGVTLFLGDSYDNAAHIDYYDIAPQL